MSSGNAAVKVGRTSVPVSAPRAGTAGAPAGPPGKGHQSLVVASALFVPFAVVCWLLASAVAGVAPAQRSGGLDFLPGADLRPEPGEQRVYLLLLLAPLVMAAAALALARWHSILRPYRLLPAAAAGQATLIALVVVSLWHQRVIYVYFASWQLWAALVVGISVSLAVALAPLAVALRGLGGGARRRLMARPMMWRDRRSRWGAWLGASLAVAGTVAYVSTTVYTGDDIARSPLFTWYHVTFTSEEFAAVLGGRTPLVDFVPQYVSLLPYLAWPFFAITGFSVGTFTVAMAAFSAVGLLSVFLAFRKVTGSLLLAALLYVPFLSITFFPAIRDGAELHSVGTYYALLPLRYFFPLVLTAVVVALAPRAREWRAAFVLGAVAGAGLVNNVEFGLAALGATVVAVFVGVLSTSTSTRRWQDAALAEMRLLAGAAAAVLLFALGTLFRSGSLPDFSESFYFSRQFAASGFFMLPMPGPVGLHLVMYLTGALALVFALVAAAVRSVRPGAAGPAGLALLAYSSVFGLGAGAYYVGRSHPLVLIAVFSAWALCSAALTVEVLGRVRVVLAARTEFRLLAAAPTGVVMALTFLGATTLSGAGVLAGQPERLRTGGAPLYFAATDMRQFVQDCATPGESVMLLHPLGHWISADLGVDNFFPYNSVSSVVTQQQVAEVVASLREHSVTSVFVGLPPNPATGQSLTTALQQAGYQVVLERPATIPAEQAAAAAGPMALWRHPPASRERPCA